MKPILFPILTARYEADGTSIRATDDDFILRQNGVRNRYEQTRHRTCTNSNDSSNGAEDLLRRIDFDPQ